MTIFLLLRGVYPFLLLVQCPLSEAGHIAWILSLSRAEALEGIQIHSSQVGLSRSIETQAHKQGPYTH